SAASAELTRSFPGDGEREESGSWGRKALVHPQRSLAPEDRRIVIRPKLPHPLVVIEFDDRHAAIAQMTVRFGNLAVRVPFKHRRRVGLSHVREQALNRRKSAAVAFPELASPVRPSVEILPRLVLQLAIVREELDQILDLAMLLEGVQGPHERLDALADAQA